MKDDRKSADAAYQGRSWRPSWRQGFVVLVSILATLVVALLANSEARTDFVPQEMDPQGAVQPQPSRAAVNAEPADKTAGIGRPCSEAGDFDHYNLGDSFEGLALTASDRHCDPPPALIPNANGTMVHQRPGRVNVRAYFYGTCEAQPNPETGQIEGGCVPPLQVVTSPACEQPISLYKRYAAPGARPDQLVRTQVRGAPAFVLSAGTKVLLYTSDAVVTVTGRDAGQVRRALAQLRAPLSSRGGARRSESELPEPVARAADENAAQNPTC
jgi:hypothetical protein